MMIRPGFQLISVVFVASVVLFSGSVVAAQINITSVRHWVGPERTRLVFESEKPIKHHVFPLKQPDRLVIDMRQARFSKTFPRLNLNGSLIKKIRTARRFREDLRVVMDMKGAAQARTQILPPNNSYRYRLVMDITSTAQNDTAGGHAVSRTVGKSKPRSSDARHVTRRGKHKSPPKRHNSIRPVVIAIDAGHGGEDPGAVGGLGSKEKNIVLSISKYLYDLIDKEPGMEPVMMRHGDYFIALRDRIDKARQAKADLFISIHADAANNSDAKGSSVFIISQRGASSEAARWLADTQNNSDLIGGVILDNKDDLLAKVLLNLTQNATVVASNKLAESLLSEMGRIGPVHSREVEQAGFVVLKSPDIPSVLVETGFISNRSQERKIRTRRHQHKIAKAILRGVRSYLTNNSVPGTLFAKASRLHKIKSGETLGLLAKRYNVSVVRLRRLNQLVTDTIRVGQMLKIPRVHDG